MPDSVRPCRNYVELHIILLYFPAFCDTILILINFTAENSRWNINIFAKVFPAKSPQIHPTISEFAESRSTPLCDVPYLKFGSMPRDGGGFVFTPEEKKTACQKEPAIAKWIHPYLGSREMLNGGERYCLWLVGASPKLIHDSPILRDRVLAVRDFRLKSKAAATRKFAETPALFCQIAQPNTDYIAVPKVSSEKRRYIPMTIQTPDVIASDLLFVIPDAGLYEFGILESNVHKIGRAHV